MPQKMFDNHLVVIRKKSHTNTQQTRIYRNVHIRFDKSINVQVPL